jgi:hypothetical protein
MARWFLILLSGCSLTLSGPDPNRPRTNRPTCDTGKGLVALDGVLAATLGLVAIGVASSDGGAAVAPGLLGSLFLLSAVHGNSTVDACNREMDNWAATMTPPVPPDEPVAQLHPPMPTPAPMQPSMAGPMQPPLPAPMQPSVPAPMQPSTPPAVQPAVIASQPPPPQPAPRPVTAPRVQQPPPPRADNDDTWASFWLEVP